MSFNEWLEMKYGISGDDLTDDDWDELYNEYKNRN